MSAANEQGMSLNSSQSLLNHLPDLLEDPDNRYWGLSDRDVPILIGAAAGESASSDTPAEGVPSLEATCGGKRSRDFHSTP